MAKKQPGRKPAAPKLMSPNPAKPATDGGVLDEQELNKVTGGTDPGESVSLKFGQVKQN